MLEAVNSVLSNASYTKVVADQQSVASSFAANPDRVQQATVQAPYVSLHIKVDVDFDKALLQLRDPETGDVVQTIPSESKLEAYRRAQAVAARQSEAAAREESAASSAAADAGASQQATSQTTSAPAQNAPAQTAAPSQSAPASSSASASAGSSVDTSA